MDLSKILKGHEEEIFYSVIFGYITLKYILKETLVFKVVQPNGTECEIYYSKTGKYKNSSYLIFQKCTLFPSKENQDWEKWEKEHTVVESCKIGQYIRKGQSTYQITNITENAIIICNIKTGKETVIKKDDIDRLINRKEITVIDNIEDILEPFDKVIVRNTEKGRWRIDLYSDNDTRHMYCMNSIVQKYNILPYYPNKHLFDNGK